MSKYATFTTRASRDCERRGFDEDEIRDLIDISTEVQEKIDPGDGRVYRYIRGRYGDGTLVEVMCEPRDDGRLLVRWVIPLREAPGG